MVTVVLHYHRGRMYPLRSTTADHLWSFRRYGRQPVLYVNVAFGFPARMLARVDVGLVVFHTSLLATRWDRKRFADLAVSLQLARDWECPKVGVPQDEFINTDLLDDFFAGVGVTHVLSCADQRDWDNIYPLTRKSGSVFRTVLTGYLDEGTVDRVSRLPQPARTIDIGYRAWRAQPWLGSWGWHKRRIAEEFAVAAPRRGLSVDINLDEGATLLGDDWFRFLLACRTTIGVEGGSSILDRDGTIRARVDDYIRNHPRASYEEIEQQCFAEADGTLHLRALSPRHLEAALTRTGQVLIEGSYGGLLKAGRHYFPLREDYSNVDAAISFVADRSAVEEMAATAYAEVVESGAVSYRRFVEDLEDDVSSVPPAPHASDAGSHTRRAEAALRWWERRCWEIVRSEAVLLRAERTVAGRRTMQAARAVRRRASGAAGRSGNAP